MDANHTFFYSQYMHYIDKNSLTPPPLIEMTIQSQESERSDI